MSRFSKAQAEAAGWKFVHEAESIVLRDENPSGNVKKTDASIVAERYAPNGDRITEEASTIGKLLERIHAYEQHLESRGIEQGTDEPTSSEDVALESKSDSETAPGPQEFASEVIPADEDEKPEPVAKPASKPASKPRKRILRRKKAAS